MCAISGSSDFERAYNLYNLNLTRGTHSSGAIFLYKNNLFKILKTSEFFEEKTL